MRAIVITGGPCSGKTTVISAIKEQFQDEILIIPEIATILLEGGFPIPGVHIKWSQDWQNAFQDAVIVAQKSFERAYAMMAREKNAKFLVCDRGLLDGAAFLAGGLAEFCERYDVKLDAAFARYRTVIHLESLATAFPHLYGKHGNESRFEALERAQQVEHATRAAWNQHPAWHFVAGTEQAEEKIATVLNLIKESA
ncbi:MAG: hypothetical protein CO042_00605 [Parcubacteria group bacterium CG_4_9_14_0_2_um_filter_41_8]|nr:MAG: hypothetical protein AUJ34_00310 [Parcubacteria group bacterium CG1_02_41_12]PIQ77963.1 MAG: hypothetical protein COV79_05730 [Parcubacteria group bacterium CG11_big_fil_rev_8_21_14_0_20_41_14]PJC41023.1 MAG: hypothetical protein CO042_00605 [Parcubacteria group bacterium CG_4_9_14_0_2_um_filter_41_8]